jgi:hypothetical protein
MGRRAGNAKAGKFDRDAHANAARARRRKAQCKQPQRASTSSMAHSRFEDLKPLSPFVTTKPDISTEKLPALQKNHDELAGIVDDGETQATGDVRVDLPPTLPLCPTCPRGLLVEGACSFCEFAGRGRGRSFSDSEFL